MIRIYTNGLFYRIFVWNRPGAFLHLQSLHDIDDRNQSTTAATTETLLTLQSDSLLKMKATNHTGPVLSRLRRVRDMSLYHNLGVVRVFRVSVKSCTYILCWSPLSWQHSKNSWDNIRFRRSVRLRAMAFIIAIESTHKPGHSARSNRSRRGASSATCTHAFWRFPNHFSITIHS